MVAKFVSQTLKKEKNSYNSFSPISLRNLSGGVLQAKETGLDCSMTFIEKKMDAKSDSRA